MSKPDRPYRNKKIGKHTLKPETLAISYGYDPKLSEGAIKPPIFQTSTFAFRSAEQGETYFNIASGRAEDDGVSDTGLAYSRINNPNLEVLEDRLTLYDQTEAALAFSSGMGAITTALLAYAKAGSSVLFSEPLYGGTETFVRELLPGYGVETAPFLGQASYEDMLAVARELNAKAPLAVIYVETPANPTNIMVDLEACVRVADTIEKESGHRPLIMADNTMLGPIGQTPADLGIDVVIYSLTKYMGGHSDLLAGAVLGKSEVLGPIRAMRIFLGTIPDPHTCWLLLRSLETVKLRMQHAFENAEHVANFLARHDKVGAVMFPEHLPIGSEQRRIYERQCTGPGSTFSFDVKGGKEAAFRVLNSLKLIKLAVSLGGTESLACHPGSTTHSGMSLELREKLGFTAGLIRVSIGIEDADDLIIDLDQALQQA